MLFSALLVYDQRRKSLKERRPWRPIVAISPFLWVGKGSFLREFGLANATEELSRRGMIKTDLPCTTDAVTQLHLFHVLCCRIRTRNQEEQNRAFFFSITRKGHRSIRKTQPDSQCLKITEKAAFDIALRAKRATFTF